MDNSMIKSLIIIHGDNMDFRAAYKFNTETCVMHTVNVDLKTIENKAKELQSNQNSNLPDQNKIAKKGDLILNGLQLTPQEAKEISIAKISPEDYTLTLENTLKYGNDILSNHNEIKTNKDFYAFNKGEYYTNFSNRNYGGGVFSGGWAMEEILLIETPNALGLKCPESLKDASAEVKKRIAEPTFFTSRVSVTADEKDAEKILGGTPVPFMIKGCVRVQKVTREFYGNPKFLAHERANILETVSALEKPENFNMLVLAAPNLESYAVKPNGPCDPKPFMAKEGTEQHKLFNDWKKSEDGLLGLQKTVSTCTDLFNTIVAGANLVKACGGNEINSGKLGCGAFANSIEVVYMMHRLASDYTNVTYTLFDFKDAEEVTKLNNIWTSIRPQLNGLSITECLSKISTILSKKEDKMEIEAKV